MGGLFGVLALLAATCTMAALEVLAFGQSTVAHTSFGDLVGSTYGKVAEFKVNERWAFPQPVRDPIAL